ncbi:MAG: hypothetical protein DMG82_25230, partial [Acidobacteria bacterium]
TTCWILFGELLPPLVGELPPPFPDVLLPAQPFWPRKRAPIASNKTQNQRKAVRAMLRHPFSGRSDRIRMMTNPDAGFPLAVKKTIVEI